MAEELLSPFAPPKANLEGVAVSADAPLANRGARLGAILLDGLIMLPALVPFGVGGYLARAAAVDGRPGAPGSGAMMAMGLGALLLLAVFIYQIYLLATRGQTLGKRWMKIRIVKLDGSNPGFVAAVLLRAGVNGIISGIPYLGGLYALIDALFIFRDDRRCVHDLIAGTRVIAVI
ncbi:MAG TPA: RDD family protein [Polyangia bacterium]|nr:RDD family protein [Polyangia bacterium]